MFDQYYYINVRIYKNTKTYVLRTYLILNFSNKPRDFALWKH
jgi:hypothetical protein